MKSHIFEVPLPLIHEGERYPDQDRRHIYEHLKYMLSRPSSFPLPAINVELVGGVLMVVRGHKYLRIAREFGHPWIRAIIQTMADNSTEALRELPFGIRTIPREVLEREMTMPSVRSYHVYFFESPLDKESQQKFRKEVAGFFERVETPLIDPSERRLFRWAFPFDGKCAEFEALIPGDSSWCEAYLKVSQSFSRNVQRIVSFQGARFPE